MRRVIHVTKDDFLQEVVNGRNGFTLDGAAQLYDHLDYSTHGRYEYEGLGIIEDSYKQLSFDAYNRLPDTVKVSNTVYLSDSGDYVIVRKNSLYI